MNETEFPWLQTLKSLYSSAFDFDWNSSLKDLNASLGLDEDSCLSLSLEDCPPIWFNGDLDGLKPGQWALVLSLNHQLNPGYPPQTRETMWDFCRTHNRAYWYPRFFRPFVRVASLALDLPIDDEAAFATRRLIFVEICPYASRSFALPPETVEQLADSDHGFKLAQLVFETLSHEPQPGVVLVNGSAAVSVFEKKYSGRLNGWETVAYGSPHRSDKQLWHKQGYLKANGGRVPVVAFPFLRTASTHNANVEIEELGRYARSLVEGRGQK